MSEGDNKAKTTRVLVGYMDINGNFVPVNPFQVLPVSQASTSMRSGIYVEAATEEPKFVISTVGWAVIKNSINMFDGSFETYAVWDFRVPVATGAISPSAYIHFGGDGFVLSSLLLYADTDVSSVLSATAKDKDGTITSLSIAVSSLTIAGVDVKVISITGFPSNEVIEIEIHTTSSVTFNVYEMRILKKYATEGASAVEVEDSSGTIINPTTKEIQEEVRDQLSLPNEDINIQTSPTASTDYSVKIDVGRGDKVVASLYSDQTPSSVKVYGSNDNTNFYELDGIDVDLSTWKTDKYNIYEFEPYTRYVKITLTTPDTAPTRVELYVKGVRT